MPFPMSISPLYVLWLLKDASLLPLPFPVSFNLIPSDQHSFLNLKARLIRCNMCRGFSSTSLPSQAVSGYFDSISCIF